MISSNRDTVKGKHELFGDLLSNILPDIEREASLVGRTIVDTGVWLVGLSTAVLALLIGSDKASEAIESWSYTLGILLFSCVVLLGVLQKVIFHIAERKQLSVSIRFRAAMIAYLDTQRTAQNYQDNWSIEYTVRRLKEDFGVDYSFLLEGKISTSEARTAYNEQLEIHRKWEQQGLDSLANIICVHTGLSKEKEEKYFEPADDSENEKTRKSAQNINLIYKYADYAYFAAALFFVLGVGVLSGGAI
jgi:hypothetical protein